MKENTKNNIRFHGIINEDEKNRTPKWMKRGSAHIMYTFSEKSKNK